MPQSLHVQHGMQHSELCSDESHILNISNALLTTRHLGTTPQAACERSWVSAICLDIMIVCDCII